MRKENKSTKEEVKNLDSSDLNKNLALKERKINKELYWVLGFMVLVLATFFVSQSVFKSLKNFEYQGLTFQKVKVGELPFYYYYYYTEKNPDSGTITGQVSGEGYHRINLYLYNDPRNLKVPVEGEIDYTDRDLTIFFSVDARDLYQCKYYGVATTNLILFLTGNQFSVEPASPIKEIAEEAGVPHITCENRPRNMVIELREGLETKITRKSETCYEITVNNCEVLEAVEKFMVQSLVDVKNEKGSQTL